jgi:hypothetical protein
MPNYRYDLSRFPPLDPVLARGLPSIVAMVEAVTARIDAGLVAVACQGAPLGDGRGSSLRAAW